jgi:hypothetical protein
VARAGGPIGAKISTGGIELHDDGRLLQNALPFSLLNFPVVMMYNICYDLITFTPRRSIPRHPSGAARTGHETAKPAQNRKKRAIPTAATGQHETW